MTKRIFILLFILISTATFARIGNNNRFWIISQENYNKKVKNGQDVIFKRYVVVPAIDKNYKDILLTNDEPEILAKFSFMLMTNKRSWIIKYINNCDNSSDINNLITALYYFSEKEYAEAIVQLEKYNSEKYSFLKLLLIADSEYELLQDKRNYKSVIDRYQSAINNTNDFLYKTIINKRIRYIKYNTAQ
ncbi:MAG: hypothetical protein PHH37_06140 [Paludibacter sp.]|nr:hypothetical protein [Paludibacter sp.]